MGKKKSNAEAVAAAAAAPAALPVAGALGGALMSKDIAALLNAKIQQFEQTSKEEQQKSQQAQKGRARATAKGKLKEAKTMVGNKEASEEEKISWLLSKLEEEHTEAEALVKEADARREEIGDAEKEQAKYQNELAQEVAVKGRLETLCRKLQQQKDALLDDRRRFSEMERQRRQELADEFQNTISDVKKTMDEHGQERTRLSREHEELLERRKHFYEAYDREEKERQEQKARRMEEDKAFEARITEQAQLYRIEATKEAEAQRENEDLLEADKVLREQLSTYTAKFNQFQEALSKSDKVLGQYKRQKTRMEGRAQTLVKENSALRVKSEKKEAQTVRDKEKAEKEKATLQERCKKLQAERQQLLEAKKQAGA